MNQFLAAMSQQQQEEQQPSPGLSSILKSEQLLKLIGEATPEERAALLQHLPEG